MKPTDVVVNPKLAADVPIDELPKFVTALGVLHDRVQIAYNAVCARAMRAYENGQPSAAAPANDTLTPGDVAKLLHKTVRGVHSMFRTKTLTGFKLGRLWRINRSEFERWQREQQHQPETRVRMRRARRKESA